MQNQQKQHRGLLNQINNTQYKASGGEIKKINGLWIATGGAKLSKEQEKREPYSRRKSNQPTPVRNNSADFFSLFCSLKFWF